MHETMAAFVADYRANALTEMSKANRGAWREPMRQGKEGECPNRDEQSESRCMAGADAPGKGKRIEVHGGKEYSCRSIC